MLLLLPLLAVAEAAGPALPADLAEADRLREDLELMAARAVWDGVERAYLALMALEDRGVVLTVEDHRQGAQAAITRGEIAAARERLVRARSMVAGTLAEELSLLIDDLDSRFGQVELEVRGRKVPAGVLAVDELPLAPDERAAVLFAQQRLAVDHRFVGLLPRWSYSLAGQSFRVEPGRRLGLSVDAPAVVAAASPAEGPRETLRFPLLDLGLGYVAATAPAAGAGTQAESPRGLGLRAALGTSFGDAWPLSAPLRIGYLSLAGNGDAAHFLVLDAGVSLHQGPNTFTLGPAVAAGWATATGAAAGAWCEEVGADCSAAQLSTQELQGSLRLAGGLAQARHRVLDRGGAYGSVGLEVGALSDSARLWPWATLLFTLEPVGAR